MEKINAYTIQQQLQGRDTVSIPWLQLQFGFSYEEAKRFFARLVQRGWVGTVPMGVEYPVCRENLRLWHPAREDVERLFPIYTDDCGCAMEALTEPEGATYDQIAARVRGEADTRIAMTILHEANFVYCVGDRCFSCVPKKIVDLLSKMLRTKHRDRFVETEEGSLSPKVIKLLNEFFGDTNGE